MLVHYSSLFQSTGRLSYEILAFVIVCYIVSNNLTEGYGVKALVCGVFIAFESNNDCMCVHTSVYMDCQ